MASSLQQLLVHLDATASAPHRLAAARLIARQHGATVSALYASMPAFIELPHAPEIGSMVAADLVKLDEERRTQALRVFERSLGRPGPAATWAHTSAMPIVGAFAQQALYADLLVLGQRDATDEAAAALPADFVEAVLLASGKPAVVIPYVGWPGDIGHTVAIAWKETPEAARAVAAALPFLQQADRVHVLQWGYDVEPPVGGHGLDLDGYLSLHGVNATWHRQGPEPSELGQLLLSRVDDLGADLLVMGCYGHGRAREWILGGVSRALLRSMTVPVLMAH